LPNSGGRKIRLTNEEYAALQRIDKVVTDRLRGYIQNPRFRSMDAALQKKAIEGAYRAAGEAAKRSLMSNRNFRVRAASVLREARDAG
jgi:type IV secretory pathway TrbF-like protein